MPKYDLNQGKRKFFDAFDKFNMSCKVTGADEDASDITWSYKGFEGQEIKNFDKSKILVEKDMSMLKIDKIVKTKETKKDHRDGMYFCKYKDDEYEFKAIANILVRIKPATDVAVVEGETLTLNCSGVGTKLKINWVFDTNITELVSYKDEDGPDGLINSTLEIQNVTKAYRGHFTCEGRYDETFLDSEKVVTSTAFVRVKDKYAALWPFILICIEVFILCAIILIYEKHRTHVDVEDSETEADMKNGKN